MITHSVSQTMAHYLTKLRQPGNETWSIKNIKQEILTFRNYAEI